MTENPRVMLVLAMVGAVLLGVMLSQRLWWSAAGVACAVALTSFWAVLLGRRDDDDSGD